MLAAVHGDIELCHLELHCELMLFPYAADGVFPVGERNFLPVEECLCDVAFERRRFDSEGIAVNIVVVSCRRGNGAAVVGGDLHLVYVARRAEDEVKFLCCGPPRG